MEDQKMPLERDIEKLEKQREAYSNAINKIDDYFEYRAHSTLDREVVYNILDNLRLKLGSIK